jgi:hypothetical protein
VPHLAALSQREAEADRRAVRQPFRATVGEPLPASTICPDAVWAGWDRTSTRGWFVLVPRQTRDRTFATAPGP